MTKTVESSREQLTDRITQLEETIAAFVVEIDKAMKGPSIHVRGQRIARLVGALQEVGLGISTDSEGA